MVSNIEKWYILQLHSKKEQQIINDTHFGTNEIHFLGSFFVSLTFYACSNEME